MAPRLKRKVASLPRQPGVYLMKDRHKRVIYVGKARNLKQRVSHYYQETTNLEPKTLSLVREAADIDYLATDSEIDALLLEAKLIRDIKPRYNVQLKDDKTFPMLAVSRRDDFPRVFITRQRGQSDTTYYGPFTNAADLRSALKSLQRIFRFRTCPRRLLINHQTKPCLLYHINKCVGPCLGKMTKEEYAEVISQMEEFLKGHKEQVIQELTGKMRQASQQRDFERAAVTRDRLNALKGITLEGKMGQFYEGALASITPAERLKDLSRMLSGLGLDRLPRKIEGLDISDIRGQEAVGALVTFIDGEPFKNGYRKYKIKTVEAGAADDYARMREVVRRRLFDTDNPLPDIMLIDGGKGHLAVVRKVFQDLRHSGGILLVGLAKSGRDHLIISPKSQSPISSVLVLSPKVLTKHRAGFTLLQYIRDEAHRFAQKYHHGLRRKALREDK